MKQENLSDAQLRLKIEEQRKRVHDFGNASAEFVAKEWKVLQALEAELKEREERIKAQSAPKRLVYYLKTNKVVAAVLAVAFLLVLSGIAKAGFNELEERASQDNPQISQLTGMTLSELEKLLDENGVDYSYEGDIFDENAKDEQTVTRVSHLYVKGAKKRVDNSRHLRKGDKIIIYTDSKTKEQQAQIDVCEAKGTDYIYSFSHGKVTCRLTEAAKLRQEKEACNKDDGKVWYSDSVKCITKEEAAKRDEQEAEAKRKADEEERKRKEEEERKAAEEAAKLEAEKKAEEEHKKAEEAAKRAEEEKKTTSTPAQPQTTPAPTPTPTPAPAQSQTTTPSTTTPTPAPSTPSASGNRSGYCKDGTPVYGNPSAKGKANDCYGHGGWVR